MAEYDIIIRGGTIVDGMQTPRYTGDIGIKEGRIAQMGGLRRSTAKKVLDASRLVVAPGFIDLHTHYDAQIQWDPHCTSSGWHGVTTVVIGNCGFGFAPCAANDADRDRLMLGLSRNEAIPMAPMELGMLWDWVSFPDFLDTIDRIPKGVNVNSFFPLGPLYAYAIGYEESRSRRPTGREMEEMCGLLNEGIDAGATGWSAQVLGPDSIQGDYDGGPMITDLMTDEELFAFARVLNDRDEGSVELAYKGSIGGWGEEEGRSFFERFAETANRPVLYQQINPNRNNAEAHRSKLRWLEACAEKGLPLYGQSNTRRSGFDFTFMNWTFWDDKPAWKNVTLGTREERKAKMADAEVRATLRGQWDRGERPILGGMLVKHTGRPDLQRYCGQTAEQIAQDEGKHVVDALFDLVVADDLHTELLGPVSRDQPEYVAEITKSPYTLAGVSDGGAHMQMIPTGAYPTELLTWIVRDEGRVSLEEMHYKLSCLPAFVGGVRDRGFLREGAAADIVVYDLDELSMGSIEVAHDLPGNEWRRIQKPDGYRWIVVNGQVTSEDGRLTGDTPGKLLRHGKG